MTIVEHDGVSIAFEVTGDGPPVVLGHSFLCDRTMWQAQVPALAARHTVINIDLRGHGASSRVTAPCTLYDLVSDVEAVLDDLGLERAVWAGLSIGGMVALRAALTKPDRVGGLILLNTDGEPVNTLAKIRFTALGSIVRLLGMRSVIGQVELQMFGTTFRREHPEVVATWLDRFREMDVPSMLRINAALNQRDDLLGRLPGVDLPALVVAGTEDMALPPDRSRRIAEALPDARLIELPGCGHLSTVEQPEEVTGAMLEFLSSLD